MKRLALTLVVSLCLFGSALAIQEGVAKPQQKSETTKADATKAAVDCSAVSDSAITTKVSEKLSKAPSLKDTKIEVETKEGVVTLKGMVKTGGLKGVATRMTRRVDCVKKVVNQLDVEQSAKPAAKTASSN